MSAKIKVIRCRNRRCEQKLNVPATLGTLKVTCPKCKESWDWDPHAVGKRARWIAGISLVVLLLVGLGLLWWWSSNSHSLVERKKKLDTARSLRFRGNFDAAVHQIDLVERALGQLSPLFFTLTTERDGLVDECNRQRDQLTRAKEQKAEMEAFGERFQKLARDLEEADLEKAGEQLAQAQQQVADSAQGESLLDRSADLRNLDEKGSELQKRLQTLREQTKTLGEIAKALSAGQAALDVDGQRKAEAIRVQAQADLDRAREWKTNGKTAQELDRLRGDLQTFQRNLDAAYTATLAGILNEAKTLLGQNEFPDALALIQKGATDLGSPDPVLEEAKKYVTTQAEDKAQWAAVQDRVLADMLADAKDWKRARQTNTKAGYKDFMDQHKGSPFAKSADAHIIDLTVAEQKAGAHGMLPDADRPLFRNPNLKHGMTTIKNDTQYTLTVLYSGPDSKRVVLSPRGSEIITLAAGTYQVSASVDAANVVPFVGSRKIENGDINSESFHIETRPGGRFPFLP